MLARLALLLCLAAPAVAEERIVIGSKSFTESVVLGEVLVHLGREAGAAPEHTRGLGGTRILWDALLAGDIHAYPEYTGTITHEILADEGGPALTGIEAIREALAAKGIAMSAPLGFNNTYAIGLRPETAEKYGLASISDLRRWPELSFGFGNEFLDRGDGWPALRERYGLPQTDVTGLDHDLAYRGLDSGDIDAMDLYSTDAEIAYYGLAVLADDLGHFPVYDAVILTRPEAAVLIPGIAALAGTIDATTMAGLNARVKLDGESESRVAADFLSLSVVVEETGWLAALWHNTLDHLALVAISLGAAIVVALPLGVLAARRPRTGQLLLAAAGIAQTIPSLALFVFMIPLLGIGGPPAIAALFLYSLLPIIRNTHAGLTGIAPELLESADALGLTPGQRLRLIELPLAGRTILAGIKTSAVINIGTATLGALIGAGGYGQPILTGIRLDDTGLILQGAIPAALLALAAQGAFELVERAVVPKGLRL